MSITIRYALGALLGVAVAFLLVAGIETIGHQVYPPPANLDFSDAAQLGAYIETMPSGAFAFVLAAWLMGTFVGGLVACGIAKNRPVLFAGIVGAFVFAATVANLMMIPHPTWFSVVALLAIVLVSWGTGRIGSKWLSRNQE